MFDVEFLRYQQENNIFFQLYADLPDSGEAYLQLVRDGKMNHCS